MGRDTHFFIIMEFLIEQIKKLAEEFLREKELELVELTFKRRGKEMVLSFIVDKVGGVTLDDCVWLNEKLGAALDKEDIMSGRYILEVASPGLDRPLVTERDFKRVIEKEVTIYTSVPVEDAKEHIGRVVFVDGSIVTLELTEQNHRRSIPLDKISKAQLRLRF